MRSHRVVWKSLCNVSCGHLQFLLLRISGFRPINTCFELPRISYETLDIPGSRYFQCRDPGHDAAAGFEVAFGVFFARVDFCCGHGLSVGDVDMAADLWPCIVAAEGLIGAEEPCGDDGGSGFAGDHARAGFRFRELTVRRAGAFGVDGDGAFGFQSSEDGFEGFDLGILTGDGDGSDLDQRLTEEAFEESIAGEIVDLPGEAGTDGGWIVEADVVGGENDGAAPRYVVSSAEAEIVKAVEIPSRDHADGIVKFRIWDGGHYGRAENGNYEKWRLARQLEEPPFRLYE